MSNLVLNKKWQKVLFIITAWIYIVFALINTTMLKHMTWYKQNKAVFNHHYYHVFQVICLLSFIRCFVEYIKEHDDQTILENLFLFVFDHAILALVFLLAIVNSQLMFQRGAENGGYYIITMFYLFMAASFYDFEDLLPYLLGVSGLFLIVTVGLYYCKVIPDVLYPRGGGTYGHSLGYIWPLDFYAHFLIIVLMYMIWRSDKMKWFEALIIAFINTYFMFVTTAKAGAMLVYLALVIWGLTKNEGFVNLISKIYNYVNGLLMILPGVSVIAALFYKNSGLWVKLNGLLNHRLEMQNQAYHKYGLTFFGNHTRWVGFGSGIKGKGKTYNFVDNAYLKCMYDYGLFTMIFYVGCLLIAGRHFFKKNNLFGALAIILLWLFGLSQHQIFTVAINPLLLVASGFLMTPLSHFLKGNDIDEEAE